MNAWLRSAAWAALTMLVACGSRSQLDDIGYSAFGANGSGAEGSGAAGSGGDAAGNPDTVCPVTCAADNCLPPVLVDETPVGWHAVDGGSLYFTTDFVDEENALFRTNVCGGTPQLLLSAKRFAGYGAIVGDDLYIPLAEPPQVVRLPKAGGAATVVYEHPPGDALLTRAVWSDGPDVFLTMYSFDGGFSLKRLVLGDDPYTLVSSFPDPDWFFSSNYLPAFVPNVPVRFGDWLVLGSGLGVTRVGVQGGTLPVANDVSVASALALDGDDLYVTRSEHGDQSVVHLSLAGPVDQLVEAQPIGPDQYGLVIAARDGELFLHSSGFSPPHSWLGRINLESFTSARLFESGQVIQDAFLLGQSIYARTEKRVVRIAISCPGEESMPCFVLDR